MNTTNTRRGRAWVARPYLILLALIVASVLSLSASGQERKKGGDHHHHDSASKQGSGELRTSLVLPDLDVVDQEGRKLKFYSDLIKGRRVVINFVYTSCQAVCPLSGRNFQKLQSALGEKAGRDVFLVTITTDPVVDTPAKLKAWSSKYAPGPGWTLVTGDKQNISELLRLLTGDGTQTGYHVPAVCLINDADKLNKWVYGLSDPEDLAKRILGLKA